MCNAIPATNPFFEANKLSVNILVKQLQERRIFEHSDAGSNSKHAFAKTAATARRFVISIVSFLWIHWDTKKKKSVDQD